MHVKALSRIVFALAVTCFTASAAKADSLFTGSQAGQCCFDVNLHQVDANNMQVTVSLTNGAQYFVASGSGNHPGFAFNLANDPSISIASISSPWTLSSFNASSVNTNGPSMGSFDYFINNPGPGASQHNDGPLVFTIYSAAGINYSDFVANSNGYYFAADIMNAAGQTGLSGISDPGTTSSVPEPSSIALLGTGLLSAAGIVRRRLTQS
ncbi:PEP-CTERM sorting domain-containing protein [Edaphobacter sp. 12200R-103]|jgi:hypothetical protein|uniref:PEP-CTERM sorting domain-containing protein n=1 Tax=Edaphobacter sp. 12200R-103 TaxID=2703788 RepID=UPI00138C1300|nr:PEP-CTERM sorting domain-containing protein [Edaphobacter sp. 12200R-103]QHS51447.1 PEP-CTERM sorting domain-containing protein [Edaphobacter sp. 12200R-103]